EDSPDALADLAIGQLLFGPAPGSGSPLDGQSLLDDVYGRDGLRGRVANYKLYFPPRVGNAPPRVNQWTIIELAVDDPSQMPGNGYFNGSVFTLTSGALKGLSSRVVFYIRDPAMTPPGLFHNTSVAPTNPYVIVESFYSDRDLATALPAAGDRFVINGLAFNGTGAGYNPATENLDQVETFTGRSMPVALLPALHGTAIVGGLDESWDAVDYQNMFLAMIDPT